METCELVFCDAESRACPCGGSASFTFSEEVTDFVFSMLASHKKEKRVQIMSLQSETNTNNTITQN